MRNTEAHIMKNSNAVHSLLSQYYETVCTLREYLVRRISPISKNRRRMIESYREEYYGGPDTNAESAETKTVAFYLDHILVGIREQKEKAENRHEQWTSFSQRNYSANDMTSGLDDSNKYCHSEVCIHR